MGELFMYCTDELADISFAQAFSLLMELFISKAEEFLTISEQEISAFVDKFLDAIPDDLKIKLKTAWFSYFCGAYYWIFKMHSYFWCAKFEVIR